MKYYTNHVDTVTLSDLVLDDLADVLIVNANTYNMYMKRGAKDDAYKYSTIISSMVTTLRIMSVGYELEFDDELEYILYIRLWCGDYEVRRDAR